MSPSLDVVSHPPPKIVQSRKPRSDVRWSPRARKKDLSKSGEHDAAFKARPAMETVKGERTASELWTAQEVHPSMSYPWKKSLLDGPACIFECCG